MENEKDEEIGDDEDSVASFDEEKAEEELEETYFIPNAIAYPLICRAMIFNDPTIFEHLEMSSCTLALRIPPIENLYPAASEPKLRM